MYWITSALMMGFIGSFHCVGMCGPIALALNGGHGQRGRYIFGRLLYNLGRTTTYAMLGFFIGLFGQGINMLGWQQGLSIALGITLLMILIFQRWESALVKLPPIAKAMLWLRKRLGKALQNPQLPTLFNVGILNGFLPCGFVYMALAGSLATANLSQSIGFMFFFGLGTIPAMMGLALLGKRLPKKLFKQVQPVMQVIALVIVGLLIVRGMNLGIPYLSPALTDNAVVECS